MTGTVTELGVYSQCVGFKIFIFKNSIANIVKPLLY
jgi:hypothetical protein